MLLKLDVLASATVKRKKPWPKLAWLGKDVGDLFLFDSHRISQLYLPSGKTKKKIPPLQNYLEDVQGFGISPNGLFVTGALNSGRIFIWNKSLGTVQLTSVLDKIRIVHPGTRHTGLFQLYISDCGSKVLVLVGLRQVFLWETQENNVAGDAVGDSLKGIWLQIQCGTYLLPDEKDKETAIDGTFFTDPLCGTSCTLSWVFNKGDRIHVTTLHLLWQEKTYNFQVDTSSNQLEEGLESSFTPAWRTFKHSLYNLTPAERTIKSRKAYVARVSPDGQIMVIAMNQKFAAHNRVMFYSLSQSAVAVIADLKGCGARLNTHGGVPSGRSWWITDMAWTRDSLLVVCITRRGSVCILTKLGEPMEISTEGCSLHTGPAFFLPLHPKITFQRSRDVTSDSTESYASEKDPLSQRFSVSVHPLLPVILSSDGYLVTVMQLPPVASYHGVMTGLMRDVTRLVPDVDVEIQAGSLSRSSSMGRINILQAEVNISRGITSTEFLSDAPSENNSTGSSTIVPGYGLASGDQGKGFFGLNDPELESSLPEYIPGHPDAISHAQGLSIVALALGTACGVNWKREVGSAMDLTVKVMVKVFQVLLRSTENVAQLRSLSEPFSSPGDLVKRRSPSPVRDRNLSRALVYFRLSLEVFKWDSGHRNVFAWAFHFTHGIIKEILLLRDASVVYRITCCLRVLGIAERVLNLVYTSKSEDTSDLRGSEPPSQNLLQQESEKVGLEKQEPREDTPGSKPDKQESDLVKPESKLVKQDAEAEQAIERKGKDSENEVSQSSQTQQQTIAQTHLSGSWLLLYNFTSESYKRIQRRRTSLFSAQESESRGSVEQKMVELLCEIQEKLQVLGVRIPMNSGAAKENIVDVSAYLDGTYHNLPSDKPQDSLFSRRRSSLQEIAGNEQSSDMSRRYGSPFRETPDLQHSRDIPLKLSPMGISRGSVNEEDSKTLLSILYLQLQQYDLRAALDLVYSLIEPQYSCDQLESYGNYSFLFSTEGALQVGSQAPTTNHPRMEVLLHKYPIARVGDNRGLKVVQTLARFMSAYFSNFSLFVFPPYHPIPLPPFQDHEQRSDTLVDAKRQGPSQAVEHVPLDRAKVAQAVRDQGLYELWSANTTVELLLVSGLIPEGAWLAMNLGDWKNALLLSFANDLLTSSLSQTAADPESKSLIQVVFPLSPHDIETNAIAMSRLNPAFKPVPHEGKEETTSFVDNNLTNSATEKKSQRSQQTPLETGTELDDDKVIKEMSGILEAGVVARLDLVPLILTSLLSQLKEVVTDFVWLVPEEFYLPYPPSYCPQPTNTKKGTMPPAAEKEEQLRVNVARIVQKILLLLNASNCLGPCVRWYTEQLVLATETFHSVDRSSSEFPIPSSLVGYADRGFSFHEKRGHVSPQKKGKKTVAAPSSGEKEATTEKLPSSVRSVLRCFRDFCAIMWLLHVRDKMSKSSRKYRELRSQSTGNEEETTTIQSICWETLLWTTRLVPFSLLLNASDKINDTLLTLLSELPPTIATAELTAQFFDDPEVVQTATGTAKFKRLMAQFRGVSVQDGDGEHEPLSVFYRRISWEWKRKHEEDEKLFGKDCDQFFAVPDASESSTSRHDDRDRAVGTVSFEAQPSYFQFLDTFFMITVSKTVLSHHSKAPYPVPLLSSYSKRLLAADTNALIALQKKTNSDPPHKSVKDGSGLSRSHSFTDVRSSRLRSGVSAVSSEAGTDIKRSNSMNDIAKLGSLPGLKTLGSQILDFLPSLTYLSRWTLEGSSLPLGSYDSGARATRESLPVMRVHVPLPLLVNGLWLLQNVYWPWVSNREVLVDIEVIRQTPPPRRLPKSAKDRYAHVIDASTPPKGLRKVLSDSNIQASVKKSSKRHSFFSGRLRHRLEADYHQSTPDMLEEPQSEAVRLTSGLTESTNDILTKPRQESTQVPKPLHKVLGSAQQIHRIPKSNSDPNIPNIVVHSPTTDEEKTDFSFALKKRKTFRGTERSPTTYHSDTDLPSPGKPIVTSTPAKAKRSKKTRRREHLAKNMSDEHTTKSTIVPDIHGPDLGKQERDVRTIEDTTSLTQKTKERSTDSRPIIRTATSLQGRRRKKSPDENKVTDVMHDNQKAIGALVAMDSKQAKEAAASDWSQHSSASEAALSQGKMELLLVVRPGDDRDQTTLQSGIPLLRIPTVLDSSQSSELTPQSHSRRQTNNTKTETGSQTEQQIMTSSFSQTPQFPGPQDHMTNPPGHQILTTTVSQTQQHFGSHPIRHHDPQRLFPTASRTQVHSGILNRDDHLTHPSGPQSLTSSASQTQVHSGLLTGKEHFTRPSVPQSMTSSASQTQVYSGIPPDQGRVVSQSVQATHAMYTQTDVNTEPKPAWPVFSLFLSQQPPQTSQQNQTPSSTQRNLPLLHLPFTDPASKLDLSKMRLLEIPKRSSETPLLHLPETKPTASQSVVPDLNKIKFLEIQPKRELLENNTEQKGLGTTGAPSKKWPLLRMTDRQSHPTAIDLNKMRLYENPPSVREAWPLLETPRQAETPQLIPLEKILAFEKRMRDKLKPLTEPPTHPLYPHEKENIQPPMGDIPAMVQSTASVTEQPVTQNKRNAPSRQRRRQALEKETRPRSTSPLYKSRRGRGTSGRKFAQREVITVQPAKKARRVERGVSEQARPEKGHQNKKPRRNKPQIVQEVVSTKEKEKSVSLSESELELSEISDHVVDISEEEEEYFRVERSPDSNAFNGDDRRGLSKGDVHRPASKKGHRTDPFKNGNYKETIRERVQREPMLEDVLPGPPSMRHIKERIGRKLQEVDQQMAEYRSGSSSHGNKWRDDSDRQSRREGALKQNIGIQVGEEKKPSSVNPVGFYSSNIPGVVGLGSTYKVSSSSQTDQPPARSPPERRDRKLVTFGVQTEKQSDDIDHVTSHAPVLPPDIILKLQMPKPDQDRILPPDSLIDYDQSVTDRPTSVRGRLIGVDIGDETGGGPPVSSTDVDQVTSSVPIDVRGRQFLSVADIDHNQWLEVRSAPLTTADVVSTALPKEKDTKEEERNRNAGEKTELSSKQASEISRHESVEEKEDTERKQENKKHSFEGADRVTVDMMDSIDSSSQRFYPLPFPVASQSSARAVSTHALSERMKEMSERIEAMDQITQNMDREFKSSRVLLSAIQSIDEVLNPSPTENESFPRSRRGTPRRWGDNAPWRRASKRMPQQLQKSEDTEDSVDVEVQKEARVDVDNVRDVKSEEEERASESTEEQIVSEVEQDDDRLSGEQQEEEVGDSVEMRSDGAKEEGGTAFDGEETADDKHEDYNMDIKADAEWDLQKDEPAALSQHHERDAKPQVYDHLDSLSLTPDKLKDIFHDKDIKRTRRDPSPDARKYLKEWMNKKRSEKQAEWRNQQEELRAQEHQPFMSPTQGTVTYKKMKSMEKERDVKRRKTEDQHQQKRIESASNLLSEMLAEPVPKANVGKPNLRYGGNITSLSTKPLPGKKKRTGERHKTLPKSSRRGKEKTDQRGVINETALQQSRFPAKGNHSVYDGTYRPDSLFSEDFPDRGAAEISNIRSQRTPRYDLIRTSSPVVSDEQDLASLVPDKIDRSDKLYAKKTAPDDDYWRSKSPTGAEFVTKQTYRDFAKNQPKRLKARETALRRTPHGGISAQRFSSQPKDVTTMGRTFARTQPTYPLLPGSETLAEVDRLLEEDVNGSSLDVESLEGIESLLEGDEELKDLLSDVDWRGINKPRRVDSSGLTGQRSKLINGRIKETQREEIDWPSNANRDYSRHEAEPGVPSTSVLLREFDLDVSPWSTGQSLRASDDVAQLLADVDEAVGNMSESTGSTRSHIDWEEVNKIMGEA